jgi:phosphoglucosamine mutase
VTARGERPFASVRANGAPKGKGGWRLKKLFGTDGIRGVAGQFPLDPVTVRKIGAALARVLGRGDGTRRVLIGRDTRISGVEIERHLVQGLLSGGADPLVAGVLPTPAVALLTKAMQLDAGIVLSASHNEFRDNGIKVFGPDGFKLSDEREAALEALVESGEDVSRAPVDPAAVGDIQKEAIERYLRFLLDSIGGAVDFKGKKILVDCANGAASALVPELFRRLSLEGRTIFAEPDGANINLGCGSLHTDVLARMVVEQGADLGISFDGDADRCILVDETGSVRDGDYILAILAGEMQKESLLSGNEIVATVMSNIGLERYLNSVGLKLVRTAVGDKYVLEEMLRCNASLGGEQSGHCIMLRHATTGDGLLTGLKMMEVAARTGRPLSELSSRMTKLPQVLLNIGVREKRPFDAIPAIRKKIEEVENRLKGRGLLLLRYSGTEPKLRIMLQGESQSEVDAFAHELAETFRSVLGESRLKR